MSQEEGGQAKPNSPNDTASHSRTHIREKLLPVPGPCLSSAAQPLASGVERQAVGDPEVSCKKAECLIRGKAGSRPSYLPKATPRRKASKQKSSRRRASEVAPGSFFPSWPPIFDVQLPGRGRRYSLVPFGTKLSKPPGTGPKSVARRRRVSEPVVGEAEDTEQRREPSPESQVSMKLCFSLVPTLLLPTPAHLYL